MTLQIRRRMCVFRFGKRISLSHCNAFNCNKWNDESAQQNIIDDNVVAQVEASLLTLVISLLGFFTSSHCFFSSLHFFPMETCTGVSVNYISLCIHFSSFICTLFSLSMPFTWSYTMYIFSYVSFICVVFISMQFFQGKMISLWIVWEKVLTRALYPLGNIHSNSFSMLIFVTDIFFTCF